MARLTGAADGRTSASAPARARPIRRYALRHKLGLLLGAVALLAVTIPTVLHGYDAYVDVERDVAADNLELARAVASTVEHRAAQTIQALELIVSAPGFVDELQARDAERIGARLERALQTDPDLASLAVLDRDGVMLANTLPDRQLIGQRFADSPYLGTAWRAGLAGPAVAFRRPVRDQALVPFVVPVRAPGGEIVGAAQAHLSLERLGTRVDDVRGVGRGHAAMLDAAGRFLTPPDPSLLLRAAGLTDQTITAAHRGEIVHHRTVNAAGVPVFATTLAIRHGWLVQVEYTVGAAFAPLQETLARSALFAVGAFAAAMLVGMGAARLLTAPLLTLLAAVRSVRDGDLAAHLPRSTTSEVARLADELDAMRTALGARAAETQRALAALQASEARFRAVASSVPALLWLVDAEGRTTFVNDAFVRFTGRPPDDLIGQPYADLIHSDDRTDFLALRDEARAAGAAFDVDARFQRADGTYRWLSGRAEPRTENGRPDGYIISCLDVHDRRTAEQRLHERDAELRLVLQAGGMRLWDLDLATGRLTTPPLPTRASDHPHDQPSSAEQQLTTAVHPADRDRVQHAVAAAIAERRPLELELRANTRRGENRILLVQGQPHYDAEGRPYRVSGVAVDVTERIRADETLARYKLLAERISDIVLFVGPDGTVLEVNRAAELAFGYERDELLGREIVALMAPDSTPWTRPQIEQALAEGLRLEAVYQRRDGSAFPVEVSAVGAELDGTTVMMTTARDVSARRAAQEALKASEARYRQLVEQASELIFRLDPDGWFVFASSAVATILDYRPEEVVGRHYAEFVRSDHWGLAQVFFDSLRADEAAPTSVELPLVTRDGREVWLGIDARPLREGGTLAGFQGIGRDVTARRQVEEALLASEAQYRGVVDTIREVVFQTDPTGAWTFLNRAWTELTGYPVEETLGRQLLELVHPDDRPLWVETQQALILGNQQTCRHEIRVLTSAEAVRWVDVYVQLVRGADGRLLGMAGTLMDVTARRHAESERAHLLLREQEARAREARAAEVTAIIQYMPCGVLVFDQAGCLALANERALEMLSPAVDPADDDGGPGAVPLPSELLDARMLNRCYSLVGRALSGSIVRDQDLHLGSEAGGRVLLGSAAPLRMDGGQPGGAVAVITDVTRERRLVRDLMVSEATLRHSLQSLLVLHEAGRALSSTLDEEEIGRRLAESCVRIARLDAALIYLDDGKGGLRFLTADGAPSVIEHARSCHDARRARVLALHAPASTDEDTATTWTPSGCPEAQASGAQTVVLRARRHPLGILEIHGETPRRTITDDALASLATHAATAFENARLYREIVDREQRLQDALRQLLLAQEEERRRVAYELHDGLAQVAAATHLSLQTFATHIRPRSPQTREELQRSLDLARRVVREARQVIAGLRPTTLDDFGLERALRLHIQELNAEGWTIEYDARLGEERLPSAVETVLYRIAQEALTNVRKHAQTTTATVTLWRQNGTALLEVVDHGVGFQPASTAVDTGPGRQIGLVGMRERAALVGGRCHIDSRPGIGTRVEARIPVVTAHGAQGEGPGGNGSPAHGTRRPVAVTSGAPEQRADRPDRPAAGLDSAHTEDRQEHGAPATAARERGAHDHAT